MLELRAGILGFGNMGGQVASIAASEVYGIPSVAINSSVRDIEMVEHAKTVIMGDGRGTGKSRALAKEFIEGNVLDFIDNKIAKDVIEGSDIVFLVCSTGGGMGSGSVPPMMTILSNVYPSKMFVAVFSMPLLTESLAAQQHTVEFLSELEEQCANVTYMTYDNEQYVGLHQSEIFRRVNEDIVKDICVLSGRHNHSTNLSSIDENDMLRLINNPGRLIVGRLTNLQQKDIKTDLSKTLREAINRSAHAKIENNPEDAVQGIGFICNLDSKFDENVVNITRDLQEEFGECVEDYMHIRVNNDGKSDEAYLILSGWDAPAKRFEAVNTRQKELQALLSKRSNKSLISGVDTLETACNRNITQRSIGDSNAKKTVDIAALMAGFKK